MQSHLNIDKKMRPGILAENHNFVNLFSKDLFIVKNFFNSSSLGRPSIIGQTKIGLGPRFILLLPQVSVLPGLNSVSESVKPASSFVIQNRQTSCSMWCLMYVAHY